MTPPFVYPRPGFCLDKPSPTQAACLKYALDKDFIDHVVQSAGAGKTIILPLCAEDIPPYPPVFWEVVENLLPDGWSLGPSGRRDADTSRLLIAPRVLGVAMSDSQEEGGAGHSVHVKVVGKTSSAPAYVALEGRVEKIEQHLGLREEGRPRFDLLSPERLHQLRAQGERAAAELRMVLHSWQVHPHPAKEYVVHYTRCSRAYGQSYPIHVTRTEANASFRLRVGNHMGCDIDMSLNTPSLDVALQRADVILTIHGFRLEDTPLEDA